MNGSLAGAIDAREEGSRWRVPLSQPVIRDEELTEVIETYRSGWLATGPRTLELERAVQRYTGTGEAIAVSSCSAALHLACIAAGLARGDAAVLPSLTFAATATAVSHTGANCLFADIISLDQPWPGVEQLEEAANHRTKAILAVAYGGHLGEIEAVAAFAERRGLTLIEDAAHASGSWLEGRHAGTLGRAGALSFSASKNLGIGEGGMLLTDDSALAELAGQLRWHGISDSVWDRHSRDAPNYEVREVGFNYRIDDPRAALAAARLRRLDEDNRRRAEIDQEYRAALRDEELLTPTAPPPAGERASHCLFTAVLDDSVDRNAFRQELARRGVQTSVHFPPLHTSPAYSGCPALPVTEQYARRTVSLPIFPDMEPWQRELVVEATREGLRDAWRPILA